MPKFMLRYENSENPNISTRDSIAQFFDNVSEYAGDKNMEDIRKAADEFMKQGINMKDATHLVCAIKAGCNYFLTTDDKLIKKYNGNAIKVRTPLTFLENLEEKIDA